MDAARVAHHYAAPSSDISKAYDRVNGIVLLNELADK
jgi:hypothetical protein